MIELIKVKHLPSGEIREIKSDRFNSEIHEKIGEIFIIEGERSVKIGEELKKFELPKKEEKIIDEEVEKVDNESDVILDKTQEELEKLSRQELMKYLSLRGQKSSFKSTKQDLLAQVRSLTII